MFSLEKFLTQDDQFLRLLEASAEEGLASAEALTRILKDPAVTSLEAFAVSRRKDKEITTKISDLLCGTPVTGLEREDIEELANALYKIPKTVEKFAERYQRTATKLTGVQFDRQAALLEQATLAVVRLVKALRERAGLEEIKRQNATLQQIEGDADKLMLDLLDDLYNSEPSAIKVVILKDLYEILEKVVDRCRDAGVVVTQIVIKHS